MTVLVIADHNNQFLHAETYHAISAAGQLSDDIHVLVAGFDCDAVIEQTAKISGVNKVFIAQAEYLKYMTAENMANLIVGQASAYQFLMAPASALGKNIMPRVAALLDVAQISEVTQIISEDTFVHAIYAGSILETVKTIDSKVVLTVRATAFEAALERGNATIATLPILEDSGLSSVKEIKIIKSERPELISAKTIVAGGRALGSEENFKSYIEPLADKLNAAIGTTRAAVDAGYISNEFQVGQTGKIVAPQLYFAIGISGAIQHLAGMKDSKLIVAINKDPDAPIFQVADYALVADLFEVVPQLINLLNKTE